MTLLSESKTMRRLCLNSFPKAEAACIPGLPLRLKYPSTPAALRQKLRDIARALMLRMLRGGEGSPALARRLLDLDPLCEEAYRFLIRHYAGGSDPASAQSCFDACHTAFDAAGIETSLEIRSLI